MGSFLKELMAIFLPGTVRYRYWDRAEERTFLGEKIPYYTPEFRRNLSTGRLQRHWDAYETEGWADLTEEECEVFNRLLPDKLERGKLRVRS
jgi:hypothetical protein